MASAINRKTMLHLEGAIRITALVGDPFSVKVTLKHSEGSECKLILGDDNRLSTIGCDSFPIRGDAPPYEHATKLVFWIVAKEAGTYPITIQHINRNEQVIKTESLEVVVH